MPLTPCSHCKRHVRTLETRCPFCGLGAPAAAVVVRAAGLTRAAMFYVGVSTVAACGSEAATEPASPIASVAVAPPPATTAVAPASAVPAPEATSEPPAAPPSSVAVEASPPPATHALPPATHAHRPQLTVSEQQLLAALGEPSAPGPVAPEPFAPAQGYGGPPSYAPEQVRIGGQEVRIGGTVALGAVTTDMPDVLDTALVTRTLRMRSAAIRRCYELELRVDTTLAGRLLVSVTVAPSGAATATIRENTVASEAVGACVIHVIQGIRLSPPPEQEASYDCAMTFTPSS